MVATLSKTPDRLCRISSVLLLRSRILLHWHFPSSASLQQHRLAPQRRDRPLRPGFFQRSIVLRGQLRRRRYVTNRSCLCPIETPGVNETLIRAQEALQSHHSSIERV